MPSGSFSILPPSAILVRCRQFVETSFKIVTFLVFHYLTMTKRYSKYVLLFISTLSIFHLTVFSQSGLVETIYFKSNSYSIDKKYYRTLDLIAKQLNSDTFGFLKIFGMLTQKALTTITTFYEAKEQMPFLII